MGFPCSPSAGLQLLAAPGWFAAVQWHPEGTADTHPVQQGLFDAPVRAAATGPRPAPRTAAA
ncbi:hypothetical protein GCM10010515_60200 [Streptomyces fructofermentans]|uniref:Glutamine amidotransferase domain-containing protein n=1 Tax=Streptomyces fructofermentans TaxID=152141 RepID=A0A918NP37_9ACTN|nr:hypothetical protein GCM10010515_60200 [Streptomyces fructofermentans]